MTTVKPRKKPASRRRTLDMALVVEAFTAFRAAKRQEAESKTKAEQLRDTLMPVLEAHGQAHGETGAHQAIVLPEPVDGYVRLVRRANVSRLLDVDAAEKLCADKDVLGEVQTASLTLTGISTDDLDRLRALVPKLEKFGEVKLDVAFDQDKLYALHQRDRDLITEAELDALIVEETRYSFHPERS